MNSQIPGKVPFTLTTRVVEQIISAINDGSYQSSECLPSERELASRLGVSRNTVTAAYAQLEQRGIIRRIHGKGAFVCAPVGNGDTFSWSGKISRFANSLDEPVLELLARRCAGQIDYPLSAGTPSLEVFSKESYAASVARVLEDRIPAALAVAPTEGQWALREALGSWLGVSPLNVMITAGAQEGIDLLARCLIEPGDSVVIDSPTYPGALQSFLSAGARLLPWGTDWSLGQLEDLLLRHRPKLVFTMPTFQNPTGRVMSLETRTGLLNLANQYRTPIIEDDVYRQTYFGDHSMPHSLGQMGGHARVISISTFSKMLAPGLRIGWLTAPLYMIKQLSLIKMRSNLFTGGLNQLVLADMLRCGTLDEHLQRLRVHHYHLRDLAVRALTPAAEEGLLRFRVPAGGLYLWCKVLAEIDLDALFVALEHRGVNVAPGSAFEPDRENRGSQHFRLCFTAIRAERLLEAIKILVEVLRESCSLPKKLGSEIRPHEASNTLHIGA